MSFKTFYSDLRIYPPFLLAVCFSVFASDAKAAISNEAESVHQSIAGDDIQILKKRLIDDALNQYGSIDRTRRFAKTDFSKASEYLQSLRSDGSWADIDYTDTDNDWSPLKHLDRMLVLTIVYAQEGSPLKGESPLLEAIENSLRHWYATNPRCKNWYKNDIGKQFFLQQLGLLLSEELDTKLYSNIL